MISKDVPRYPSIFIFPVRPTCHSCWDGSDYHDVRPSRQPFWQQACPCLTSWDHFWSLRSDRCGCRIIAVWLACHSGWEAAMGQRLGSPLHDPYVAWMLSLGLRGLFLAALHQSQNQ